MKKYIKEMAAVIMQLLVFYGMPLLAGSMDAIGMVFLMLVITLFISLLLGLVSKSKIKFLYPAVTAILFAPSIMIYYNESASVHMLWYFVDSLIGVLAGVILKKYLKKT